MAPPLIKALEELHSLVEEMRPGPVDGQPAADHHHLMSTTTTTTTFSYFDADDRAYFGRIAKPKRQILTVDEYAAALEPVPDADIYPLLPEPGPALTRADDDDDDSTCSSSSSSSSRVYIKRPPVHHLAAYRAMDCVDDVPRALLDEARALQRLLDDGAAAPHPNIVRFRGCRVRRGRITALVMDRHGRHNLAEAVAVQRVVAAGVIVDGLAAAVRHLHAELGLAHNDVSPRNVVVVDDDDDDKRAVLVDFGSCRRIGERLGVSRGTRGWVEDGDGDVAISRESNDLVAVERIRAWLEGVTRVSESK